MASPVLNTHKWVYLPLVPTSPHHEEVRRGFRGPSISHATAPGSSLRPSSYTPISTGTLITTCAASFQLPEILCVKTSTRQLETELDSSPLSFLEHPLARDSSASILATTLVIFRGRTFQPPILSLRCINSSPLVTTKTFVRLSFLPTSSLVFLLYTLLNFASYFVQVFSSNSSLPILCLKLHNRAAPSVAKSGTPLPVTTSLDLRSSLSNVKLTNYHFKSATL